jgi:hypothetical protein
MMKHSPPALSFLVALAISAATAHAAADSSFRPEKLTEMDTAIEQAIANKKCPGGVLWFEHRGAVYHKAYGNRALVPTTSR